MSKKTHLTAGGFKKLEEELLVLQEKKDRLTRKIEEVSQPEEVGDAVLVIQLKDEIDVVQEKTRKIKEALDTAEIITKTKSIGQVALGSQVTVQIKTARQTLTIVGDIEADPSKNYISDQSPLGQALLGKKKGEEIKVVAPVGKITYKILKIG